MYLYRKVLPYFFLFLFLLNNWALVIIQFNCMEKSQLVGMND